MRTRAEEKRITAWRPPSLVRSLVRPAICSGIGRGANREEEPEDRARVRPVLGPGAVIKAAMDQAVELEVSRSRQPGQGWEQHDESFLQL